MEQDDEEEVKRLTRLFNRRARKIRIEEQINKFRDWEWDPIKYFKMGYIARFTNLRNERGELVNDRMRPNTLAYYFERVQWARNHEIYQQRQKDPDVAPIYDTEANVKHNSFTKEELDKATTRFQII